MGAYQRHSSFKGLRRLKEALVGSEVRHGKPVMIPAEDWLADLEAKIAGLEHSLGLDSRPGE